GLVAQALECVRRCPRFPYAAAKETRAALLHCLCHGKRLLAILDRARSCDNREFAITDRRVANPHNCFLWTQIERDQLIRFSNANDFCDTGQVFKTPAVNGTFVTCDTDCGTGGSGPWMRAQTDRLDDVNHRIDLVRRGARFHYNQHRVISVGLSRTTWRHISPFE